ncbi:MAG: hypothetical protein M3R17_09255 [Bacteroidota bacterium]|nr:hypothetical protein [Bacteroidota bacterium]
MLRTLGIAFFVLFLSGNIHLGAQCVDSTQIQYGAYCDPQWIPVCACNGTTYRNDCFARNEGVQTWNYGICDAVDFDFNPNPPVDYITVDAILKTPGYMQVQLIDRFGRIFYSTAYQNVTELIFQITVKGFPPGLYYIMIWCNEGFKVRKMVVTQAM